MALRFLRQSSKATSSMVSSFLMKAILLPPTMREMATMDSIPAPTLREREREGEDKRGERVSESRCAGIGGAIAGSAAANRARGGREKRGPSYLVRESLLHQISKDVEVVLDSFAGEKAVEDAESQ